MNFQRNEGQKVASTGCWKIQRHHHSQQTDRWWQTTWSARTKENVDLVNNLALSQDRHALDSQNGPCNLDNQLRSYEIITMSSVAAFYWITVW